MKKERGLNGPRSFHRRRRRNDMKFTTRRIALDAIGIALFVALSMCLQVPVFQNYYLCLGYAVMAVYLYTVGIPDGTIIGMFGGTSPYNLVPNVPTVTESKVSVDTANKKLNVSLKVSAN